MMDEGQTRRRSWLQAITDIYSELTKVTLPSREYAVRLSLMVLAVAATMAVFLGAMLIHGVFPGPTVLTDNTELVLIIALSILASNVLTSIIGLAVANKATYILRVPVPLLLTGITVLSLTSVLIVRNAAVDMLVTQVEAAMETLEEIADSIEQASQGIREVSAATDDQAVSTEEVASMVTELVDETETVAEEIEEIAAANEKQAQKVEDISRSVQQLN
jgi:hypothetical protein